MTELRFVVLDEHEWRRARAALSDRDLEVLRLRSLGAGYARVAEELELSVAGATRVVRAAERRLNHLLRIAPVD